ncbi:MAG TPA: hypothetical protein VFG69_21725, partial [Nannocystaceae bacterium]|nr:hypothetical protein [Nannocystaceae bacterium]
MPFVVGSAWAFTVAAWLGVAPLAAHDVCREVPRGPTTVIGTAGAALRVEAFIDPSMTTAHASWVEMRRVVGESDGGVRIDVRLVRPGGALDPRADRV